MICFLIFYLQVSYYPWSMAVPCIGSPGQWLRSCTRRPSGFHRVAYHHQAAATPERSITCFCISDIHPLLLSHHALNCINHRRWFLEPIDCPLDRSYSLGVHGSEEVTHEDMPSPEKPHSNHNLHMGTHVNPTFVLIYVGLDIIYCCIVLCWGCWLIWPRAVSYSSDWF